MQSYLIRRFVLLGAATIIGMIAIQTFWLKKTWELKDKEFDQTVRIILRKVAVKISAFNGTELPKTDLIQRRSSNFYAVNVNASIFPSVLEDYLIREMENHSWNTDFEYAVYNCTSDEMVYGNYCTVGPDLEFENRKTTDLPKFNDENLIYYFVVTFPSRENYLLSNMRTSLIFGIITTFAIIFFLYSIWVVIQQKRLSELQADFINNMTHEFKTPIASIKVASEVLLKDEKLKHDSRSKKYLEIISNQNTRLNDQVEKVLHVAKLEQNKLKLNKEVFSLKILLEEITENENIKGNAEVSFIFDADLEYDITADKHHTTNVIYNIVDNAIKYCKQEPEIQISLSKVFNNFELSISDNGIGIKKEAIPSLFDKFYRVPTGNIHDVKGFGIGLFYVKQIVDSHHWKINVQSEDDKGTTFIIKIPVK